MGKISNEIDKLIAILEEKENLFLTRIDLLEKGEVGKGRFIDERIFPSLEHKQNKQALEVTRAFSQRLGDGNEKQEEQTQDNQFY